MSFDGNPHFNRAPGAPPRPATVDVFNEGTSQWEKIGTVRGDDFRRFFSSLAPATLRIPERAPFPTLRDFHAHFTRAFDMPEDLGPFTEAVRAESQRIARMLVTGPAPQPPLKRGDEVKVTLGGYVQHINPDGTYVIAPTREPFADPVELVDVPRRAITHLASDMREPVKVGDTIDGRRVRETAWKRGTVLRDVTADAESEGDLYVLLPSGYWRNLSYDEASPGGFEFEEFDDQDSVVVEFAPGK